MGALVDTFGRQVTYLRLSVTDRCDYRCIYCMSETMQFLPRADILSLEELNQVATAFIQLGVNKIRLTGGEPLVRTGIVDLCKDIAAQPGLTELAMTTNGSRLRDFAKPLFDAGVSRLNVSLDSLNADTFRAITRTGNVNDVLEGIETAKAVGFKRLKINVVMIKGRNDHEIIDLIHYAKDKNIDITFIEEMPLGNISEHDRSETMMTSDEVREVIKNDFDLLPSTESTGGPSRYWRLKNSDIRIGFISPHSHNFCHLCNRVRVTVEGKLLLCLGNEHSVDLKSVLRKSMESIESMGSDSIDQDFKIDVEKKSRDQSNLTPLIYAGDMSALKTAITESMKIKPERHYFNVSEEPQIVRFMNMTGG
jgi:cyclic pyranopterin phosphate synthase